MSYLQAIIVAIVEGLTEFLPVSSTGHMILASHLMGLEKQVFTKLFEIAIQLGAILSVVVFYRKKFLNFKHISFYIKLIIAVIPALVLGKLFSDKIDDLLESTTTVGISLLLGGIVLLFIDNIFNKPQVHNEEDITYKTGFFIGLWQCLAMIPGVSRSASSIIGGMSQKLSRSIAAEFSFFLAVPTMFAATGYKLLKTYKENPEVFTDKQNLINLGIGNVVAFIVTYLSIKYFIKFVQQYGFKWFGWYRIVIGIIVILFSSKLSLM